MQKYAQNLVARVTRREVPRGTFSVLWDEASITVRLQPLDGSPGKQITNFKSEQIVDFHWSFDGSKLVLVRGHTDSDVVLLQESKP